MKLMPYKDDTKVQTLIDRLEESLYSKSKVTLDKKLIKELIQKYNLDDGQILPTKIKDNKIVSSNIIFKKPYKAHKH